uniref:hypothetical protein n=1 Tax=Microbacterium azadirachtae TaxID=582680 RepID=UPI001113E99F|nr:hypothetical protein [Microbacterium azadirachtae]
MNPRRSAFLLRAFLGRRAAPALRFGIATAVVAVSVGLAGCTPATAPKPTPTPLFASKAEAFKAAERVYRDYVDAANARRTGASTEPESFLIGKALEDDISTRRMLEERKVRVTGNNVLTDFRGTEFNSKTESVEADVCLDVSASRVIAEDGADLTPADRGNLVSIRVLLVSSGASLKISESNPSEKTCVAH